MLNWWSFASFAFGCVLVLLVMGIIKGGEHSSDMNWGTSKYTSVVAM